MRQNKTFRPFGYIDLFTVVSFLNSIKSAVVVFPRQLLTDQHETQIRPYAIEVSIITLLVNSVNWNNSFFSKSNRCYFH